MIFLQALSGSAALNYIILWIVFIIYLIIGVPILLGFFMKIVWKKMKKRRIPEK